LSTESLAESLLNVPADTSDVLQIPASESDRRLLATILIHEEEELTPEVLEAAVRALRRIHLKREQERVRQELKKPGISGNRDLLKQLLSELERISRALRDPSGEAA